MFKEKDATWKGWLEMSKGKSMAAVEIRRGWVLHVDGVDRKVQDYRFRAPSKEDQLERHMTIWFTDGYQVSGDEGQTVYVISVEMGLDTPRDL